MLFLSLPKRNEWMSINWKQRNQGARWFPWSQNGRITKVMLGLRSIYLLWMGCRGKKVDTTCIYAPLSVSLCLTVSLSHTHTHTQSKEEIIEEEYSHTFWPSHKLLFQTDLSSNSDFPPQLAGFWPCKVTWYFSLAVFSMIIEVAVFLMQLLQGIIELHLLNIWRSTWHSAV